MTTSLDRRPTVTPPPDDVDLLASRHRRKEAARWTAWFALLPAVVIALVTRIDASTREMWADENATYHAISISWTDMGRLLTRIDLVHATYYVFMRGWLAAFGDSLIALRAPSIIAMAVTGAFTVLIGRRLVSTPVGVVAGLLLAAIPAVSRYAEEVRSYALVTMLATVGTDLLLRALDKPTGRRWALYVICTAFAALGNFVAITVVGAHILYALAATRRTDEPRRWGFAGAFGAVCLVVIPLVATASKQSSQVAWISADSDRLTTFPIRIFLSDRLALIVIGLALLGVLVLWWRNRPGAVLLLTWAVGPMVFCYVSIPVLHLFVARYLLFTLPAWALLAAATICFACRPFGRKPHGALWLVGALLALPALGYLGLPDQKVVRESPVDGQPSYRPALFYIRDHAKPGDGVVYNDKTGGRHDQARAMADYEWRDSTGVPKDLLLARTAAQTGYFEAQDCADPAACLAGANRIWVLATENPLNPWTGMAPAAEATLSKNFEIKDDQTFPRVRVVLLVRTAPPAAK